MRRRLRRWRRGSVDGSVPIAHEKDWSGIWKGPTQSAESRPAAVDVEPALRDYASATPDLERELWSGEPVAETSQLPQAPPLPVPPVRSEPPVLPVPPLLSEPRARSEALLQPEPGLLPEQSVLDDVGLSDDELWRLPQAHVADDERVNDGIHDDDEVILDLTRADDELWRPVR